MSYVYKNVKYSGKSGQEFLIRGVYEVRWGRTTTLFFTNLELNFSISFNCSVGNKPQYYQQYL